MTKLESVSDLVKIHDYVSSKLNNDFGLDLPVIGASPPKVDHRIDAEYRHQLLCLRK
jgi:hypothetical protein